MTGLLNRCRGDLTSRPVLRLQKTVAVASTTDGEVIQPESAFRPDNGSASRTQPVDQTPARAPKTDRAGYRSGLRVQRAVGLTCQTVDQTAVHRLREPRRPFAGGLVEKRQTAIGVDQKPVGADGPGRTGGNAGAAFLTQFVNADFSPAVPGRIWRQICIKSREGVISFPFLE